MCVCVCVCVWSPSGLRHCAKSLKVAGSNHESDINFPATQWYRGRLSHEEKWVPGIFHVGQRRPVCRANNLTTFMCRMSRNMGVSPYWNPQGLSRDYFTFFILVLSQKERMKELFKMLHYSVGITMAGFLINLPRHMPQVTFCS